MPAQRDERKSGCSTAYEEAFPLTPLIGSAANESRMNTQGPFDLHAFA